MTTRSNHRARHGSSRSRTIDIDGRSITVSGVEARLTADAAAALNAAFATSAFTEGLLLGTATVAAEAR